VRNATLMREQLRTTRRRRHRTDRSRRAARARDVESRACSTHPLLVDKLWRFPECLVAWRWNANPAETTPNRASRQLAYMLRDQVTRLRSRCSLCPRTASLHSALRQALSRGQRVLVPANRPPCSRCAHANPVDVTRLTGVVCAPRKRRAPESFALLSRQWRSAASGTDVCISRAVSARLLRSRWSQRVTRYRDGARPRACSTRVGFITRVQWTRDRIGKRTDLTKAVPKRDIACCGQSGSRLGSASLRMLRTVGHGPMHRDPSKRTSSSRACFSPDFATRVDVECDVTTTSATRFVASEPRVIECPGAAPGVATEDRAIEDRLLLFPALFRFQTAIVLLSQGPRSPAALFLPLELLSLSGFPVQRVASCSPRRSC
jgi:hypothetical protein